MKRAAKSGRHTRRPGFGGVGSRRMISAIERNLPVTSSTRQPGALLLLLVVTALLLAACGTTGSGTIVTEQRDVGSFDRIEASSGVNVEITVDPTLPTSVEVMYDDNVLENVATDVSGDTLVIKLTGSTNISGSARRVVTVVTDRLVGISASGGANVSASGATDAYQADVSGGADLELRKLEAASVVLDASGGATLNVYASESATGEASGGANVSVFGNPPVVAVDVSGGADLDIEN